MSEIPTLQPGEFDFTTQGFFSLNNPCCCLGCPEGYMAPQSLSATITFGGTEQEISLVQGQYGGIDDPITGWIASGIYDPVPGDGEGSDFKILFNCSGTGYVFAPGLCCDAQGRPLATLLSYDGNYDEDLPPADTTLYGFRGYAPCTHGYGEPVDDPIVFNIAPGDPFTAADTRVLTTPDGSAWRCGCSTELDVTFAIIYDKFQDNNPQQGSIHIYGAACVINPCAPPSDKTRYWYVLKTTYPYIEKQAGGSELDQYDEAPDDWISGPYFRTYVIDTPDNPETPYPDCTGHWVEVPDPEPYEPTWCVEYQDQDEDGNDVGLPYPGCHVDGREATIQCRNWFKKEYRPKCEDNEPPQPQTYPSHPPITEDFDVDLDPARVKVGLNPTATKRKRKFIDGPWPNDSKWCCLTCPSPCARMSKADHSHRWEVNGWVDSDFGKMPGKGTVYENEQYLICRLGWNFNEYDTCRFNSFSGSVPENCGEPDGPPFNGYSAGKKVQFHNILGGPKVVIKGDDESDTSEGIFYPFSLGEVNSDPGHWASGTGSLGGGGGGPDWFPPRWWVLPGLADELDPDSLLAVQETSFIGVPSTWAAGPFDAVWPEFDEDATDEEIAAIKEAASLAAKAEAEAAAIPDGPWWCCRIQDVGSEGDIGEPYLGCVKQQLMPDPGVTPPAFPGDTTPPRYRIGISISGVALDPDHDYPEGVTSRTVTLTDGPWIGAVGVGPSRLDRCKANCPPCSQAAGQANDEAGVSMLRIPSFWYSVLEDGDIKAVQAQRRPDDSVYVAGPFYSESQALSLGV